MRILIFVVSIVLVLSIVGCGSRAKKVEKSKDGKGSSTTTDSSKSGTNASSPAPATSTPSAAPAQTPAPTSDAKNPAATAPAATPVATPAAKADDFGADVVSGKSINTWIALLGDKDKANVVEACGALEIAFFKARAAVPKLTELSTNSDAEIAAAAKATLAKINAK
jgi:hypothetical protein